MPETLIHNLDQPTVKTNSSKSLLIITIIAAILLGVGTGFFLRSIKSTSSDSAVNKTTTTKEGKKVVGIVDKKTFNDTAEGVLREGGIDGEGTFHLERQGGPSKNVYLSSSSVDLSQFIGKKIKVWGQTYNAEKAGWLMDVGYVEVE